MKENPNFDPKVESISNIDELVSWWKKGNHEDQSYFTCLSTLINYFIKLVRKGDCGEKFFAVVFFLLIFVGILLFASFVACLCTANQYVFLIYISLFLCKTFIVLLSLFAILISLACGKIIKITKPDQYLSKYDLFNDVVKRRGINVEKLASYCNKKIIEIDDRIKEYQAYWKVFMLTIITSCFLSLLPSTQDMIFKIFEQEHTEDVSTLFTALTLYWGLIAEVLALLFLIYIIVMIFIRVIYRSYANRKTYYSLFTLSNSSMIF